jgi:hypothetical protein
MRINQDLLHLDRVQRHTAPYVNERIQRQIEGSVAHYAQMNREVILKRLAELDHEWDVDRALMALFPVLGGATLAAGLGKKGKGWLYLFAAQLGFLFVHATYGWCPPVAVLRRMGFRTRREIDQEKSELQKLLEESPGFRQS